MYIDTHAHFDICIDDGDTEDSLISLMKEYDIEYAVQVGVDSGNMKRTVDISDRHENIFFTLGIHPASKFGTDDFQYLKEMAELHNNHRMIGIGETGLDYHWMENPKNVQIALFEKQIDLADKNDLAVIVHSRDAMDDTIAVLKNMKPAKAVIHCFSGDVYNAEIFTDMGFYISFAGNLTYKKAENLHEAVKSVPIDRLLFETDSPYLAPVPERGKRNRPDFVRHTYEFAAKQRKMDLDDLRAAVRQNFMKLIEK